jgi:hypothetical protein
VNSIATSFTRDTRRDDLTATSQQMMVNEGEPPSVPHVWMLSEFKIQSIQIHQITWAFPKNKPTINFFFNGNLGVD